MNEIALAATICRMSEEGNPTPARARLLFQHNSRLEATASEIALMVTVCQMLQDGNSSLARAENLFQHWLHFSSV